MLRTKGKGIDMFDICIIGGGASGMAAAVTAAEADPDLNILIIEKKEEMGRKIIASGNGRCNLSNLACRNYGITEEFFRHLGLLVRSDNDGRVYPYTEESKAVYEALKAKIELLGVNVITDSEVTAVERTEDLSSFHIITHKKNYSSKKVLLATGGKSAPSCGTTGDGYRFARKLGHTVTKLVPVLTAVETAEDIKAFAGIRAKAEVSLRFKGNEIFCEAGEVQFTKTGISGICVFNLSRYLLIPEGCTFKDGFKDYEICIDFVPDMNAEELLLLREKDGFKGEAALKFVVRDKIGKDIYEKAGGDVHAMASLLKSYTLHPVNVRGWDFAQVTKGGVVCDEINPDTMESLIVPDLFFAGEVMNFDGPCGGFNLQHAWETGIKAGKGMTDNG